jgi:hypothetical protein
MNVRIKAVVLSLALGVFHHAAYSMEVVAECRLGEGGTRKVQLLRDYPIGTTAIYYLGEDGGTTQHIYRGEDRRSRGDSVQAACAGTKERVLVVSGEFSSNYLQGVAIRYNTRARRIERVDFAERYRPSAVYLSSAGMLVLISNRGRNESSKRYIIYRYSPRKDEQSEPTYSDRLPSRTLTRVEIPSLK